MGQGFRRNRRRENDVEEKDIPFGSDPIAIARWRALVKWFHGRTKLNPGTPPQWPTNAGHPPPLGVRIREISGEVRIAWEDQDARLTKIMSRPEIREASGRAENQWLIEIAGYEGIDRLDTLHQQLRDAARSVLALDSGKAWAWKFQVSPEAVGAAKLLAKLPPPYALRQSTGKGDRIIGSERVELRHRIVRVLDELRCPRSNTRLTPRELTVLFMLTVPIWSLVTKTRPTRDAWEGRNDWKPTTHAPLEPTSAQYILRSRGFRMLKNSIVAVRKKRG